MRVRHSSLVSSILITVVLLSAGPNRFALANGPTPAETGQSVGAQAVLYDQTDTPDPSFRILSQDFLDAGLDGVDSFAADDFVVPANQIWQITSVEVLGIYDGNGDHTPPSVNVFFYSTSITLPTSTPLITVTNVVPTGLPSSNFTITLSSPATLSTGAYWLSVQANMFYTGPSGQRQWLWRERLAQANNRAAWKNPGGQANLGKCIDWGVVDGGCFPEADNSPDLLFRLNGTALSAANKVYLPLVRK